MKIHKLKIRDKYADAVRDRKKTFEIRYNDRAFQVNHRIRFIVVDKNGNAVYHPLIEKTYKITYILSDFEGLAEGYVGMSIMEV